MFVCVVYGITVLRRLPVDSDVIPPSFGAMRGVVLWCELVCSSVCSVGPRAVTIQAVGSASSCASTLLNWWSGGGEAFLEATSVVLHFCGHVPSDSPHSRCRRVMSGQVGHMKRWASNPRVGSSQMGQSKLCGSGEGSVRVLESVCTPMCCSGGDGAVVCDESCRCREGGGTGG